MSEQSATTRNMARLLLTVKEAAEALGIGRSKVYELVMSGQLESVRIGGSRRVPVDALHNFVNELRLRGAQETAPGFAGLDGRPFAGHRPRWSAGGRMWPGIPDVRVWRRTVVLGQLGGETLGA